MAGKRRTVAIPCVNPQCPRIRQVVVRSTQQEAIARQRKCPQCHRKYLFADITIGRENK